MLRRSVRNVRLFDFLAPRAFGHRPASVLAAVYDVGRPSTSYPVTSRLLVKDTQQQQDPTQGIPDPDILFFNQRLVELRQAISARDVRRAWEHWARLRDKGLLPLFGPQLRKYSQLLATLCPQTIQAWDPHDRKAIEEIAFYAATKGAPDALVAYMAAHLRSGDRTTTLGLYARFLRAIEEKPLSPDIIASEEDQDVDELVIDLPIYSHPHYLHPPSILLAVVIAYAIGDSFHDALRAYLQSPVPISPRLVTGFLSTFPSKSLAGKGEDYVRRLRVARYVSEPRFITARASVFAASRDVQGLKKFYQSIIDGICGPEPYIAPSQASVTLQTPIALNEINWATILTAFLQCNCRDLAETLWDDMLRFQVRPTVITWTALLVGYERMGEAKDAEKAWHTMTSTGIEPTASTFRAIISVLFTARKPDDAMGYFALFQSRRTTGLSPTPEDVLTLYNTVLHGLLKNHRERDAHALLQRLREEGPKPDAVSFNSLLNYHSRRGEFRIISRILDWMREDGLVGDVYTFSTVLSALLKVGRTDATDAILSLMRKQNVEPNVAFFTSIINHQMEEGTEQSLRAAMDLLQKMEENPEVQPNEVTYTGMLTSLHRHDWRDLALAQQCKHHVLERMKKRNMQLNRAGYHVLIKACLENLATKGTEDALGYYRKMVQRRISIGPDTWYVLLRGLIAREAWVDADAMVEEMTRGRAVYGGLAHLVWRIKRRKGWKMGVEPRPYI
ncbi:hypothetical protein J3R82DRAFT_688 [Butyriboletus roseoflavus]|nr:hypothetical protein J3R82DRAFT_688 [Butyriboletus roseoflavus]